MVRYFPVASEHARVAAVGLTCREYGSLNAKIMKFEGVKLFEVGMFKSPHILIYLKEGSGELAEKVDKRFEGILHIIKMKANLELKD